MTEKEQVFKADPAATAKPEKTEAVRATRKTTVEESYEYVKKETGAITNELQREIVKLKDPTFQAGLMYALVRERESANLMLKDIQHRIEQLESRLGKLEDIKRPAITTPELLPEVDEFILALVKKRKALCAEDVAKVLGVKRNAASQRMYGLFEAGLLGKKQVGRKVYYFPAEVRTRD